MNNIIHLKIKKDIAPNNYWSEDGFENNNFSISSGSLFQARADNWEQVTNSKEVTLEAKQVELFKIGIQGMKSVSNKHVFRIAKKYLKIKR